MKTFSELISWELEQERKRKRSLAMTSEDASGKLSDSVLRKLKYLNSAGASSSKVPETFQTA